MPRYPAFATFQIFPPSWDWRRVCELGITSYQACVGAVAFVHPETLGHSSYAALVQMMGAQEWGITLWIVALAHAVCIIFNGRHPLYSGALRMLACGLHMGVLLLIGLCYMQVGDFYRLVTTFYLLLAIFGAASIAAEDVARVVNRRKR